MKRIEILYEDDICLVLNKPAGLAVQGGKGVQVSLDSILAETYSPRPLLVHRLDKDTSGLILTAKTREAAARFSRLLGEGRSAGSRAGKKFIKQYLAVCAGRPAKETGLIRLDLESRGSVKKSETRYKALGSGSLEQTWFSLLELELGTGRMHQIRRHLAMTGNPILGDDKYGDFALNKILRKTMQLKRLLLHASRLVIPQGDDGFQLDISAPPPEYFGAFLELALLH
ncbi:MAG: RluA family pseudouridine synthase [Treponema sp.]|nr:RluA family pseudouridine synthase [Treponema sp.]